ncbi:SMI1/KNR4 family protein [Micromonospora sp. WMMD964]|uniref:SMI1/KNR4 family protein n=1 Tax=Micromonospora sp. WMMD964 TaxID=3016091 RepID=UPI00249C3E7D|nr:SMI1/KNR4 family protein [Micromonospora sp. WMMD964]WFF00850.1 SMI1/KNR4 family protein [Micromonospora sp. WMMD964]
MTSPRTCIVPSVTPSDWSDVRKRLARVAAAPGADDVFGSSSHGWQLEPPLLAEELAEAETQLQVELPDDYRSFLLKAGRGGSRRQRPRTGADVGRRHRRRWRLLAAAR